MSITINLYGLLLCTAIVLIVGGIVTAMIFPSKSQWLGDGPGCAGVVMFFLGIAASLVVIGIWIGRAMIAGGAT